MRLSFTMIGAGVIALLGVAGLMRGAVPIAAPDSPSLNSPSLNSPSLNSPSLNSPSDSSTAAGAHAESSMQMNVGPSSASAVPVGASAVPVGASAGDGGPITITGAYVQQPASPDVIAAYFSLYNNTGSADTLTSVDSGAGQLSTIHADNSMTAAVDGLALPSRKMVSLSVGQGHIMIEKPVGTLVPGQTVNLVLHFANAPQLTVAAPVIAIGAAVPKIGG